MTRRKFISVVMAVVGLLTLKGIFSFTSGSSQGETIVTDIFPSAQSIAIGGAILGRREMVWLVRDDKGYYALDRRCPHLGCLVKWEEGQFVCPCHHSKYQVDGSIFSGPTGKALAPVKLELDEQGNIIADTSQIVSRQWRLKV